MEKEFIPYTLALELKSLGFDEPCFIYYKNDQLSDVLELVKNSEMKNVNNEVNDYISAPTFSQAVNFLYICSNKQIDIELKASDTYEERIRKITKGCEDLRNLQNNKSN